LQHCPKKSVVVRAGKNQEEGKNPAKHFEFLVLFIIVPSLPTLSFSLFTQMFQIVCGLFLNCCELKGFYQYRNYVRHSSSFHICALTFASTIYCCNLLMWFISKEIFGGGQILSLGDETARILGVLFGFFGQIICAVLCSTYGFIAYERYVHICLMKKKSFGIKPHVMIWCSATVISVLLCFFPFFGRISMQPSGQYTLTDFYQLKSALWCAALVM